MDNNATKKTGNPYEIFVSSDKMKVTLVFFEQIEINSEQFIRELGAKNIVFGIDKYVLSDLEKEIEVGKEYIIAKGIPPKCGKDGDVECFFKTKKDFEPDVDESGNINFKSLHLVNNVDQGAKLAKITYPTDGENGTNVFGKVVAGKRGKNPLITFDAKSVEKNENDELVSLVSGAVSLVKGKITVKNQYIVKGDVGPVTGNINFNGSVIVYGNVLAGYEIRTTGDVEVKGSIEGGSVYSEGNVIVHKGIIGMDKGVVECSGFLHSKYIQSSKVICKEDLVAESLMHSDITCTKNITVQGRRGVINGGTYRASADIVTKNLGSTMCTRTTVEVGVDPKVMENYRTSRDNIAEFEKQIEKLDVIIKTLSAKLQFLDDSKKLILTNALSSRTKIDNDLNEARYLFNESEEAIQNALGGMVKVTGKVHQGVKVQISECVYYVKDELKALKFVKENGDVVRISL